MREINTRFQYHADTAADGTPVAVFINPSSLGQILLDYESASSTVTQALADALREAIKIVVRRFRPNITDEQLARVNGVIIAQDIERGRSAIYQAPRRVGTGSLYIRDIVPDVFHDLVSQIQQSNDDIDFRDLTWWYKFNINTLVYGGSIRRIMKRSWTPQRRFTAVWEQHKDENGDINCAAYSIAYVTASISQRRTNRNIIDKARSLMNELGWVEDISIDELKNYVRVYSDYRIVLLTEGVRDGLVFTGTEYEPLLAPDGTHQVRKDPKLIQMIYMADQRHFVAVSGFSCMLKHKKKWNYDTYCFKCNYCYNHESGTCKCSLSEEDAKALQIKRIKFSEGNKRKCACGLYGCTKRTCSISCTHCKSNYKRGDQFSHRCIMIGPEKHREFWKYGDDESGEVIKTKLWVYDIESSMIVVPGDKVMVFRLNYCKEGFVMNDNHEYMMDEVVRTKHKPNLVVARNVFMPFDTPELVFKGENALLDFIKYMVQHNSGFNICYAHNAQGYDSRLISTICREQYNDENIKEVSCLARGNKFLELAVCNVRFRDSLCFLVGSLAKLAEAYFPGDTAIRKGDFPHQFNTPENYGYIGDVPAKEYYGRQWSNKDEKHAVEFDIWYATERELKKGIWNFDEELEGYCKNDVMVLAKLVLAFHDIAQSKCAPDEKVSSPWFSVTAPSWVHKTIKRKIYPTLELEAFSTPNCDDYREHVARLAAKETWAVLVENEYWFARLALRGGRTEIRKVYHKVSEDDKKKGTYICYQDIVSMYPYTQVAFDYPVGTPKIEIYDSDMFPCYKHKAPYKGNVWEKQCECTLAMRREKIDERLVIDERFYQPTAEDILKDDKFFGIVCASMTPPKNLFHPVLVHYDEALGKCVGSLEEINKGVFTSVEFIKALKKGYKLNKIHRFDRYHKAPGLWNPFIKQLYIDKMANGGSTPPDSTWDKLIQDYEERFGMGDMIRQSLINGWGDNPAKKQTAKICINSAWGKHCQRPNMPQVQYIDTDNIEDMMKFDKNLNEGTINLLKWDFMGNQTRSVIEHNGGNGRIDLHDTYLPAGLFVPAYGRMMLWEQLDKLGDRVLMHDTDSIVYIHEEGKYNIPESKIWGGWERENIDAKNGGIEEFIGIGPKSYALKAFNGATVIKNKGVSLKHAHKDIVNLDTLRKLVLDHLNDRPTKPIFVPQMRFLWTLNTDMETEEYVKRLSFSPDSLKGILDKTTGIIYPFGWEE